LEYLAADHRIAGKLLEYRQYAKLQSTYVEGLLAILDPATKRIHTSLNQTITVTGRLSSTEPNLQNIPVRMEEGRRIRRAFLPSPGNCLLSGDYSQIELRILAHLCGDEALREAFRQDQDIHRKTAAEVFGLAPEEVSPQQRRAAKAVNFGLIYGISDFGLAQDLGIARNEAKAYMERYFSRYPEVKRYFDRLLAEAVERGYVETMFRRRRYLPELKSANFHTRSFGQRAAMNAPIQGTAADVMKLAMVAVRRLLEEEGEGEAMVLQVHDELLFDLPRDRALALKDKIRQIMEEVVSLSVPLRVDLKIGADWYGMEKLS
jgi:DNA polymerase-1